ncbi:MAG: RNA-directed DNA polymerase [Bacteroidota bacterium]
MKRATNLIEPIADPDNLRLAFWKASKGKRYKEYVWAYQKDLDAHLLDLRHQILRGKVKVGEYRLFTIYEPKERKICASAFPERVLHHALMNVCHEYFERKQIFHSYASRKGKGSHAAIAYAQKCSREKAWYLKLDVRKFFASIHHVVIMQQLQGMFKDRILLSIFKTLLKSYADSPARGVPIGNLTSQYMANHYLVGLDHYIKEVLKIRAYVRYMDDMVLWADEKGVLQDAHRKIESYIHDSLRCELKPEQLNTCYRGLPFLGFRIYPGSIRLTHQNKRRFIRKYRKLECQYHSGEWDEATCQRRVLPLLAFVQQGNAQAFLQDFIYPA